MVRDLLARIPVWADPHLLVTPGHWRSGLPVNQWLADREGPAIVWITSDEEGDCPFWQVDAPVWKQMPNPHRPYWPDRVLPLGYTPHTQLVRAFGFPEVKEGWVFVGQNTNSRRKACITALSRIDFDRVTATPTFAAHLTDQGVPEEGYMRGLWSAGWAPAPSGNVSADSFRMWEALEAQAVPILDATTPRGDRNTWPDLLGDHPFPMVYDWEIVGRILEQPPPLVESAVWYSNYKQELVNRLVDDWHRLIDMEPWPDPEYRVTGIITASPIPTDPDPTIISQTISSLVERLPKNAEVVVAFDGPRPEDDREAYEQLIRRVAWEYPNLRLHYTGVWKHQAGTLKEVLPKIRTQTVLVCEQDTPLIGEVPVGRLVAAISKEEFNHIRLHYDASIHPEHAYLMLDEYHDETDAIRTVQYSQRPHVALTSWYRDLLAKLPDTARTYVEDWCYGFIADSPWEHHKLGVYAPTGDMKRSTHLDGRAGVEKGKFWW